MVYNCESAQTVFEKQNIPNVLTALRVLAAPFFVACYYVFSSETGAMVALVIFIFASLTDWFDGYLARRWQVESKLGACFDPIADKILIITALFVVVWQDGTVLVPAIIIAVREVIVSGLRESLAGQSPALSVTHLGKIKTAVQMLAIGLFLVIPALEHSAALALLDGPALVAMWAAALLAIISGVDYFKKAWPLLLKKK